MQAFQPFTSRSYMPGRALALRHRLHLYCSPARHTSSRNGRCRAAQAQQLAPFEWELEHSDTKTRVRIFGVDHRCNEEHIGRYILSSKPDAVIVETACNPTHGSMPGNLVSCADYVDGPDGFFQRMFCSVAAQLNVQGEAAWAPGGLWEQVITQFRGEQLAYVAAFTVGAKLVFGDRPKATTIMRLWTETTALDLDEAFGVQAQLNYLEQLTGRPQQADQARLCRLDQIMLHEREAVMCRVLDDVCRGVLPQSRTEQPPKHVVLVAGGDHVPGIRQLWQSGSWQQMLGIAPGADLASSPLMSARPISPQEMEQEGAGVKRALLDAAFSLSASADMLQEIAKSLPPLGPEQEEPYAYTSEIYGTTRMLLACLSPELLKQTVSSFGGSDFGGLLEPVRRIRPVHGGAGYTHDVWADLVSLNFQFGEAAEE